MISVGNDSALKSVINTNLNIKTAAGCTIEYNLNSMVNGINISSTGSLQSSSFTKLFPVDSITKPNRPALSGIKYYINGEMVSKGYVDQRTVTTPKNYRVYIPGADNLYKYYLSGSSGSSDNILITYDKKILVNKIVLKFELSHSTPSTFSIFGTAWNGSSSLLKSGTSSDIPQYQTVRTNNEGVVSIYYTGSGWSFLESDLNKSAYVEMSAIRLEASAPNGAYMGIIEFSPRYVIDVSEDIVNFTVTKESSSSNTDSLPIGYVNSNTLKLQLAKYNNSSLKVKSYDKTYTSFEPNVIYFYKMAEVKPFINVYHSAGLNGSTDKYDRIPQGTFYMDTSEIGEYGDFTINALDGAKFLQDTIPQDSLCENYAITAIIRRMLDNIGFTNYNFNISDNDSSIISPLYWWTDDTKTIWEHIQELCRDSQMTAVFDEHNILQFYTRDFLYNKNISDWTMYRNQIGNNLPNIIDMTKQDLPSANQVKVLWQTPQKAINDQQSGSPIWQASIAYLSAFELLTNLYKSDGPGSYMSLNAVTINDYTKTLWANSYTGFLLLDSEVIEFDAVQYQYKDSNTLQWQAPVDISSSSDILKYKALADSADTSFIPTGRFRIKTRGAFGTYVADHYASYKSIVNNWTTLSGIFMSGAADPSPISSSSVAYATTSQSLFNITNSSPVANSYAIGLKSSFPINTYSNSTVYNAFGTTLFLNPSESLAVGSPTASVGGFAFHANSSGNTMYLLQIRTSIVTNSLVGLGSKTKPKDIELYKIVNGKKTLLADTQTNLNQITNINQGEAYKIDIVTQTTSTLTNIKISVNGITFSVNDSSNRLAPTSTVGLAALMGKCSFDYVYGIGIDQSQYSTNSGFNIYTGKYSDQTINFLFGNKIFDSSSAAVSGAAIEDFGPVAREIRQDIVRYNTRPAYPLVPSVGVNKFVNFLGYKMSPFGAELYIINNSGTYVPVSDSQAASYFIAGKTLSKSSQLEYKDYIVNEYTIEEPVIFESLWLQTEGDVKRLSEWVRSQWSKKQSIITLNIFGNPMISVGDVIEISYDYQDLRAGQKFLVNSINQNYTTGLETSIVCRTL